MQIYDISVAFFADDNEMTNDKFTLAIHTQTHRLSLTLTVRKKRAECMRKLQHIAKPHYYCTSDNNSSNNDLRTIFSKSTPLMTRSTHNCKYCFIFIYIFVFLLFTAYISFCSVRELKLLQQRKRNTKNYQRKKMIIATFVVLQ